MAAKIAMIRFLRSIKPDGGSIASNALGSEKQTSLARCDYLVCWFYLL